MAVVDAARGHALVLSIDQDGDTGWIDDFALIIVELHDWMLPGQGSSRPVTAALAARDRDFLIKGENVFSFRNGG